MGLYRNDLGLLIDVPDDVAEIRGYTPLADEERAAMNMERGMEDRSDNLGSEIMAAATGVASGMTLGLSDVAIGQTFTPLERQQLEADIGYHPYLRTGGEIVGAVGSALAAPGSLAAKTPAGYLSNIAARQVEKGLAKGGVSGTARALTAMGGEGAAQSVGQYIGHAAIEDKDLAAEGIAGSAGSGFGFGAAFGGAALGVVKGTVAARKMFSRVAEGEQGAQAAESAWSLARQESLDTDLANMQTAEKKLEQIRLAKREALKGRAAAARAVDAENLLAGQAPLPGVLDDVDGAIPTHIDDTAPMTGDQMPLDPASARLFDEGMPSARDQVNAVAADIKPATSGAKTEPFSRKPGSTQRISRGEAPTELEGQLAGTKAQLDEGAPLKSIKASKGNESNSIEQWLHEEGAAQRGARDAADQAADIKGAADLRNRRSQTLAEMRYTATSDLLGPQMARMERDLVEALDEYKGARTDFEGISDGVPESLEHMPGADKTSAGSPRGKRNAAQIIDDAHEEALLRAQEAGDPVAAGQALEEAHRLEDLLEEVAGKGSISDGIPRSATDQLGEELLSEIQKIWKMEEKSAKLSDVLADQAHPSSTMRAKALRTAEKESERKMFDRAARAMDDAETFGPTYASPKERILYAKERRHEANVRVDDVTAQERDAAAEFKQLKGKYAEGEKAKKAALREDAKAARAASGMGAQDVGGIMELADLPGLPKPSDLPVVGPLLGAWLKFRTLKKAASKMMGRVPASADAKAAAMASRTRDRFARAIDRSLGLVEQSARRAIRPAPAAMGILAARVYDDGEPDAPKGATLGALAATRIREIAAYVHAPGAIEKDVRWEMRGITDPDLIAAAEKHRRAVMEHLLKTAPKGPDAGLLNTVKWEPSPAQAMSLARRMDAISDPAAVMERLADAKQLLSLEAAEAMRDLFPRLFREGQRRVLERAFEAKAVPYRQRIQMSLFFKVPLDPALDPDNLRITQSVYERKPSSPAFDPAAAPPAAPPTATPSIANPVDLSQAYMPFQDRR